MPAAVEVAAGRVELEHPASGWPQIIEAAIAIACVEPDAEAVFGTKAGRPVGEVLVEEPEGLAAEVLVANKVFGEARVVREVRAQAESNVIGRGALLGAAGSAALAGENREIVPRQQHTDPLAANTRL
ncbi:hypothetical protein AYO47_03975 [Planctomyces sp. SCGC AG-212-M04]|nr:hypothetical protein AYO47_03975 [Planctomyces sp. SCGC AG-212-M04]